MGNYNGYINSYDNWEGIFIQRFSYELKLFREQELHVTVIAFIIIWGEKELLLKDSTDSER